MNEKRIKKYYTYVKSLPCLACGQQSEPLKRSEVDHIFAFSTKQSMAPRSHKGMAAYYCVPLCKQCHIVRHRQREEDFYKSVGYPPKRLYAYLVHQILAFFVDDE